MRICHGHKNNVRGLSLLFVVAPKLWLPKNWVRFVRCQSGLPMTVLGSQFWTVAFAMLLSFRVVSIWDSWQCNLSRRFQVKHFNITYCYGICDRCVWNFQQIYDLCCNPMQLYGISYIRHHQTLKLLRRRNVSARNSCASWTGRPWRRNRNGWRMSSLIVN